MCAVFLRPPEQLLKKHTHNDIFEHQIQFTQIKFNNFNLEYLFNQSLFLLMTFFGDVPFDCFALSHIYLFFSHFFFVCECVVKAYVRFRLIACICNNNKKLKKERLRKISNEFVASQYQRHANRDKNKLYGAKSNYESHGIFVTMFTAMTMCMGRTKQLNINKSMHNFDNTHKAPIRMELDALCFHSQFSFFFIFCFDYFIRT